MATGEMLLSDLTAKTTEPADTDIMIVEDADDTKKINYSLLADAILNKLKTKSYTGMGTTATIIPNAIAELGKNIGTIANLETTKKDSTVSAINELNSRALPTKTVLTATDDLNTTLEPGYYRYFTGNVPANAPFQNTAIVEMIGVNESTGPRLFQRVTRYGTYGYSAYRCLDGTNITPWIKIPFIQSGKVEALSVLASSIVEQAVAFPVPFKEIPTINAIFESTTTSLNYEKMCIMCTNVTVNGFTLRVSNSHTAPFYPIISWTAIQA